MEWSDVPDETLAASKAELRPYKSVFSASYDLLTCVCDPNVLVDHQAGVDEMRRVAPVLVHGLHNASPIP